MFRLGFGDTFQQPEVSKKGKRLSGKYYQDHSIAPPISTTNPRQQPNESENQKNIFVQYQKEFKARKLLKSKDFPRKPGNILKLPLDYPSDKTKTDT